MLLKYVLEKFRSELFKVNNSGSSAETNLYGFVRLVPVGNKPVKCRLYKLNCGFCKTAKYVKRLVLLKNKVCCRFCSVTGTTLLAWGSNWT